MTVKKQIYYNDKFKGTVKRTSEYTLRKNSDDLHAYRHNRFNMAIKTSHILIYKYRVHLF